MLKTLKNAHHLLLADSLLELLLQLLISDIEARTAIIPRHKSLDYTPSVSPYSFPTDRKIAQTKQTSLSKDAVRKQGVCCV
jgi:hypothetical protein